MKWIELLREIAKEINKNSSPTDVLDRGGDNLYKISQGKALWWVLSALRGPDEQNSQNGISDHDAKWATTEVIRGRLGLWENGNQASCLSSTSDTADKLELRKRIVTTGDNHFGYHARMAFHVLGLKWDEVNKIEPI